MRQHKNILHNYLYELGINRQELSERTGIPYHRICYLLSLPDMQVTEKMYFSEYALFQRLNVPYIEDILLEKVIA